MVNSEEPESRRDLWRDTVARFARFNGLVAEVDDPLTWGLDLTEETIAGGTASDPTEERFLRSYWSLWRDTVDVETLRADTHDPAQSADITRMALCSALAAPHHPLDIEEDDFLDTYAEYRAAMREIVATVESTPIERSTFVVDGLRRQSLRVTAQSATAVYTIVADRVLVVAGPDDLVSRLTIVMRPISAALRGYDEDPGF